MLWGFLLETVFISLSGVMSPGPVTAVTVGRGSESPRVGALVAIGHGIVEFPLIALVFWGFGYLVDAPYVTAAIAFLGGVLLLVMGIGMFRSSRTAAIAATRCSRLPLVAGILLSIGNPFFLIWWATVGAALISRSIQFGIWGLVGLALAHWFCDLGWCTFLSTLSFTGGQFFGRRYQRVVFLVCGAFLVAMGLKYVLDGARVFLS
jgi:threonine/homoserine/homoserine lactone efflux protein